MSIDDNPEWTDEMLYRAKPLADVFPDLADYSIIKEERYSLACQKPERYSYFELEQLIKQARHEAFIMGFAACLLLVSIAILIWWAV